MAISSQIDENELSLADILQKRIEIRAREILGSSDNQLKKMVRQIPANTLDRIILGFMAQTTPSKQGTLAQQAAERLSNFRVLNADSTIHQVEN